jgi:hypothetical protein
MRIANDYKLVVNGDMSGDITSPSFHLHQGWLVSMQAVWTGDAIGSLELLISNDNVTFSVYTGSGTVVNGPGDFLWNCVACGFNYMKVKYTFGSNSGTLNVTANYKGIV